MSATTPEGIARRNRLMALNMLRSGVFTAVMVSLGVHGLWAAYLVVSLLNCPIGIILTAKLKVKTEIRQTFNLKGGPSWAFLLGDFILAGVGVCFVLARPDIPELASSVNWLSLLGCWFAGLVFGWAFREKLDIRMWLEQNTMSRRDEQSKLWHDLCTYPSMTAVLLYLGVPVLVFGSWSDPLVLTALGGYLVWVALGVFHNLVIGLDTHMVHADFSYDEMCTITPCGVQRPNELNRHQVRAMNQ